MTPALLYTQSMLSLTNTALISGLYCNTVNIHSGCGYALPCLWTRSPSPSIHHGTKVEYKRSWWKWGKIEWKIVCRYYLLNCVHVLWQWIDR